MNTLLQVKMSLGLFSFLLLSSHANPVSTESTHAFDLGPLDSCSQPNSQQLSSCSEYVDYAVPSVLLSENILAIKHKRIAGYWKQAMKNEMTGTGNGTQTEICGDWVLMQKCKEEFPPCQTAGTNEKMVSFASTSSCSNPCQHYEPSCGPNTATVSLTTCYPVTSLNDYSYNYCSSLSGWSSSYITKWMHILLQEIEYDLSDFEDTFTNDNAKRVCLPLYTELLCGSIGRCSEQGVRAELNATNEVCTALMDCVGSSQKSLLSNFINCTHYPGINEKETTMATPITQATTAPPPTEAPVTDQTQATSSSAPPSSPASTRPATNPTVAFPEQIASGAPTSQALLLSLLLCTLFVLIIL